MTTKERTLRFIAYKGLSVKKFEEMCGLSNGYVNSMRSGYGSSKLSDVLTTFPELNMGWLVNGEGDMLNLPKEENLPSTDEQNEMPVTEDTLIAELRAQIERLESKIDNLNQEIGEKNALLKMMHQQSVKSI